MAYPLENQIKNYNTRLYHRYGSQLGVASCTFVRTLRFPPQSTFKSHLPAELGEESVATPYHNLKSVNHTPS